MLLLTLNIRDIDSGYYGVILRPDAVDLFSSMALVSRNISTAAKSGGLILAPKAL